MTFDSELLVRHINIYNLNMISIQNSIFLVLDIAGAILKKSDNKLMEITIYVLSQARFM